MDYLGPAIRDAVLAGVQTHLQVTTPEVMAKDAQGQRVAAIEVQLDQPVRIRFSSTQAAASPTDGLLVPANTVFRVRGAENVARFTLAKDALASADAKGLITVYSSAGGSGS